MTKYLMKCKQCQEYGIANPENKCRFCGGQLINPKPPKFSLTDKYGKFRRQYFKENFEDKFKKLN